MRVGLKVGGWILVGGFGVELVVELFELRWLDVIKDEVEVEVEVGLL